MSPRRLFTTLLCAAPLATIAAPIWQQSASAEVELGVRDKYGETPFRVEFVVVGPEGRRETKAITVEGGAFGLVRYPADFEGYLAPGAYRWTARVGGKVVASGRFSFEQDERGRQRLVVED